MRGRVTQQGSVQTGSGGVGASGAGYGIMDTRSRIGAGQWEPTVVYLLLLVLFEMAAFAGLRYVFRSVHGG